MSETTATKIALIKQSIAEICKDIGEKVSKSEFISEVKRLDTRINPIEKIVYGMVGFILIGFLGAVIGFFIKK